MLIKVTQEHIKNGRARSPWNCPVAKAVKEVLNLDSEADFSVLAERVKIGTQTFPLPSIAKNFVIALDMGNPNVQPIEFELPLEELAA
jgi:hypothetical protein